MANTHTPQDIDAYIALFEPDVQEILQRIRETIREEAPEAEEVISYRMPAFRWKGILAYFAAFKEHIGLYPPVSGDPVLLKALAPYLGDKGNLKFPLNKPIPYHLVRRIIRLRLKQHAAKAMSAGAKKVTATQTATTPGAASKRPKKVVKKVTKRTNARSRTTT